MDLLHQRLEPLLYVQVGFCAYLHERDPVFLGDCGSFFGRDVSFVIKVALGGQEYLADIRRRMCFYLGHPSLNILKGSAVYNGIREYDASGSFVVRLSDVLESLLACSIPDLQLVPTIGHCEGLDLEVYPYGGHIGFLEVTLAEPSDEIGLSDSAIADDDDFRHEIVLI